MKRSPRPDLTAAEAARVGEDLREARLTLGASVEDIAERLRINRRYIHALEEGRVRDLPGPAYAVGFVRSYAAALGLDADEAVRRFRDVTGNAAPRPGELVFPEPVPSRGMPAGALVVVGVVLAVGAYVAWYNWSGSDGRVVDAVPPVPPRLEQAAQNGERIREPAPVTPASPSGTAARAAPGGAAAPAQAATANVTAPAPATPPAPIAPVVAAELRVSLRARGESWVQVRDTRANQVLFDRVMRNGDTYDVPSREGLVLTTGKAENLDILVNGEPSPALAGAVGVRRGIVLDRERLQPTAAAEPATPRGAAPAAGAPSRP